jgi:carboxypeptidase C (cathepsin A)
MILTQIAFALLLITTQAAVVLNPITSITTKNLMYTGTIDVLDTEKLFFTYYGIDGETNADKLSNNPTIIAVGTPGRSAQYMNLGGIGPKILSIDGAVSDNANRATQYANVMFIDLLGSGFSFASSPSVLPK